MAVYAPFTDIMRIGEKYQRVYGIFLVDGTSEARGDFLKISPDLFGLAMVVSSLKGSRDNHDLTRKFGNPLMPTMENLSDSQYSDLIAWIKRMDRDA